MLKGNEEESNMYIKAEYNARGDKLLEIVSTESGTFITEMGNVIFLQSVHSVRNAEQKQQSRFILLS